MSGREWKPGDVVADDTGVFFIIEVTANSLSAWTDGSSAIDADGNGRRVDSLKNPRPLVVIDPEDHEQVRNVLETFGHQYTHWTPELDHNVTKFQAALRSLTAPPKPDEPTGLGAVVEDATGEHWIRAARIKHGWHRPMGTWAAYVDISAVKVLSQGVTA